MKTHTRAEALRLGLKKYHSGTPCKNGHNSYRYPASGTCYECLRESVKRRASEKAARDAGAVLPSLAERQARIELLPSLVQIKLRVYFEDGPDFLKAVVDLVQARHGCLFALDIVGQGKPCLKQSGTSVFKVSCDVADIRTLQDVAAGFMAARRPMLPTVGLGLLQAVSVGDLEGAADIAAGEIR